MVKKLLRPDEVARVLKISRWTVYRWVEEGRLDGIKIGKGTLRITVESVDRLLMENRKDVMITG